MSAKIKDRDLFDFFEHLASTLKHVPSIHQSIQGFSPVTEGGQHLKRIVIKKMANGSKFCDALQSSGAKMDAIEYFAIKSGEDAGKLAETLTEIITIRKERADVRSKVKSAMIIPVITMVAGLIVFIVGVYIMIPLFERLFEQNAGQLPELSRRIFAAARFIREHTLYELIGIGVLIWGIKTFFNLWKMPFLRHIARYQGLTTLFFNLKLYLSTGYPLQIALQKIYRDLPANNIYEDLKLGLRKVLMAINNGESPAVAVERVSSLGKEVSFFFDMGELTGYYDEAISLAVERFKKLYINNLNMCLGFLNPILFLFTLLLIVIVLASLYIPVFQSINAISL